MEISKIKETKTPSDLYQALSTTPKALATWQDITPLARRDWILWLSTAKKLETRQRRIEKACDMLASGKRRVCCFGGAKWLMKQAEEMERGKIRKILK